MENECISHNSIILVICAPKIITFGGDLVKFRQKQFGKFFLGPPYRRKSINLRIIDHGNGIICHSHFENRALVSNISSDFCWRHSCSFRLWQIVTCLNCASYKCTYLLTYLPVTFCTAYLLFCERIGILMYKIQYIFFIDRPVLCVGFTCYIANKVHELNGWSRCNTDGRCSLIFLFLFSY